MMVVGIGGFFLGSAYCAHSAAAADSTQDLPEDLEKLGISKRVHLCRLTPAKEGHTQKKLLEYTTRVSFSGEFVLNLDDDSSKKKTQFVANLTAEDKWKNHMMVSSFRAAVEGKKTFNTYLKTAAFGELFHKEKENVIVDWASAGSTISGPKQCHKYLSHVGNGHSEAQLVDDITSLWVKDSSRVIKMFVPKEEEVSACGLNLYSSFDVCDVCLDNLIGFRKTHQKGQESISEAIRTKLGDRFVGKKEDAFVLLYHSHYPYKESTYYAENEESYYDKFDYSYGFKSSVRKDVFVNSAFEEDHVLFPHKEKTPLLPNIIFGHIHNLSGKQAPYKAENKEFTF